jgi:hypothetical protein
MRFCAVGFVCAAIASAALAERTRLETSSLVLTIALPTASDAWRGAQLGAQEAARAAALFGSELDVRWLAMDEEARGLADAAAVAHVIIGGASDAAAAQLVRIAREQHRLVLNVGGRADELRTCDPLLFHVAPSEGMFAAARSRAGEGDSLVYWHPSLERYGAAQLNERYQRTHGGGMTEAAWGGWMAVKVAWEAAQRSGSAEPSVLAAFLTSERAVFDGHKGVPLSFRARTRQLRQPLYIVRRGAVREEVPPAHLTTDIPAAELLDRAAGAEPSCGG